MIFDSERFSLTSRNVHHFDESVVFLVAQGLERASFSWSSSGKLSPKVSNYHSNCSLVGKWRSFWSKIWIFLFLEYKAINLAAKLFKHYQKYGEEENEGARNSSERRGWLNFGEKLTWNLPIHFMNEVDFWSYGNLCVLLNNWSIHNEITQLSIETVLWIMLF